MKKIRLGIVGTGWISDALCDGVKEVPGLSLTAVYSRSIVTGRDFAMRHGIDMVFTDLVEMARSDKVDAVYIASPNALHFYHTSLFLKHKKHVLCEKPFAANPWEAKRAYKLARQQDVVLLEAIMMMHLPARVLLHEAVARAGNIRFAKFDFSQLSSKYAAYQRGETPNIFDPTLSTGALMDLGVYCVYPAVDLFGMPQKISAFAGFLRTGADGYGSAVLEYKNKQVVLTYSKVGQAAGVSEIQGDLGTVYTPSISKLTHLSFVPSGKPEEKLNGEEEKAHLMALEAKDFYRFVTCPQQSREEYEQCRVRALQVAQLMWEIRLKAGIRFPSDRVQGENEWEEET